MGEELLKKATELTKEKWVAGRMDMESYNMYDPEPYKSIYICPDDAPVEIARGIGTNCRAIAALIVRAVNEREHLLRVKEAVAAALKNSVPHSTGIRLFKADVAAIKAAMKKVEEG